MVFSSRCAARFAALIAFGACLQSGAALAASVPQAARSSAPKRPSASAAARPATPQASTPAPVPSPDDSPAPGVSEQELEEIRRALGGSAAASPAPLPPASPLPMPAPGAASASVGPLGPQGALQVMNPNISVILDGALAVFSDPKPLQAGAHDPTKNGFNLQQLELSINSAVDPYLRFDSNLVLSQFGIEIEEAYATTLGLPCDLQARFGQFLTRFGRINPTHPHSWDFADQPLVMGKFMGGEGNRGLGAELSYLTPLPWYAEIVTSATEANGAATARSFFGAQDLGVLSPRDVQATAAFKQFFPLSDDWSLAWGFSGATGPNPTGRANRSDLYGTDLYLKWRPLSGGQTTMVTWTTEALARRRQVPNDLLVDYGAYSSVFWRFAQQWGAAVRYDSVSGLAGDYLDPDWNGLRDRVSANVTFWPTEFSRFRWQVSMDRPSWRPEPVYATFLSMETLVGAHGAHTF